MKTKRYRPYEPNQVMLLPPSLHDWLNPNHLAYFVMDLVERLDLSAIEKAIQDKDPRGNRPYPPVMMVALLIYAWCVGVRSSRAIERLTWTDVAFRVVAADNHPCFSTLATFRRTHSKALADLFVQVVQIADKAGLVALAHAAVDGTKVKAAASKHRAMSYERMQVSKKRLEKEIARILEEAEQADLEEDERYGEDNDGSSVPEELARRETRLAKIEQAMKELDDDPLFTTSKGLPKNRPPRETDGTPKPKAQRNFTDPDSRIMEAGGAFIQGYNCQAAVDDAHQFIVGHAVTNLCPDNGNLVPMLQQVEANCGRVPDAATADTGYWNAEVEQNCRELGTEAYVATGRVKHGESPLPASNDPPPADADAKERMRARLNTLEGRDIYRKRKYVVEPVFGQIKDARSLIRFLRKGMAAVSEDWCFECTCHNVLKLFRAGWKPVPATA